VRAPLIRLGLCAASAVVPLAPTRADEPAPLEPYQGSTLITSHYRASDDFDLQTSTFQDYSLTSKQRLYAEPPLHLHGAHRTLWYQATGYATAADVMRHYREELSKHGFEVLYDSSADPRAKKNWSNGFLTAFESSHELSAKGRWAFNGADSQSVHTLTAKHGDRYVSLLAVDWPENVGAYEATRGAYAALEVIDSAQPRSEDDLGRAIASSGHVALYDSDPLPRIVQLLKSAPTLKLLLVVHSDNQGPLEAQLAQTKKRALALVSALKSAGVVGVTGEGVGPLAPIASNATEEGRALNRRVEVVAQ
jgi:OOP family OmpA-OmpF porin